MTEPGKRKLLAAYSTFVHNDKDAIEAYTFHAVCAGKISVSPVQNAIADRVSGCGEPVARALGW